MLEEPIIVPTVDDSRILYHGAFRYRSLAGLCALMLGGMTIGVIFALRFSPVRILVPVAIAVVTVVVAIHIRWMVQNRQRMFSITMKGIVDDKRFVPWSEIRRFAAEGQRGGLNVTLFYERVSFPLARYILFSSSRVRPADYEALIAMLRDAGVGAAYPHLVLGGYQSG